PDYVAARSIHFHWFVVMAIRHLLDNLVQSSRRLPAECEGNVTITFALALIPMVGLIGAGVDYSRASAARSQMQAALDATALMVAKEAPNLTPSQVTQKASDYFNAMFTRPDATNKQLSVVYNANSNVTLTGSATLNTMMARVIGKSQMNIG